MRFEPGIEEPFDTGERVPHRESREVRTRCVPYRSFAVFVHHHIVPADEDVAVVEMERPPEVALVIKEFIGVVGPLVRSPRGCRSPYFSDLHDGLRRLSSVRKESLNGERQPTRVRLDERQRLVLFKVQGDAVSLE